MAFVLSPTYLLMACLAGWINREQRKQVEYLQAEVRVLREQTGKKRLKFTNDQRRLLGCL